MIFQCLYTVGASLLSLAAMFASTKIIGNKQLSQMNLFDYINGITIGSIAAEMAVNTENIIDSLVAIAIYTSVLFLISKLSEKNIHLRRILTGRSLLLMRGGRMYEDNFRTGKIDLNEFLTQCRVAGFFNLDEIDTAVLEQNGKISFMPKPAHRPLTPRDMAVSVPEEPLSAAVILDGEIMEDNLKMCGYNREWLEKKLAQKKLHREDIFLAMCSDDLTVFKRGRGAPKNDIFQ